MIMKVNISRRSFLELGGLAFAGIAFRPDFPRQPETDLGLIARVATKQVDIRSRPSDEAPIVGNRFRDQLIHIYEELHPADAPKYYNTLWYRIWGGYIHSGHLQIVSIKLNDIKPWINPAGELGEITVPYSTAFQFNRLNGWFPWRGSRLYYSSTHWATSVDEGPDGKAWYQITNELSDTEKYFIPAEHLRIIPPQEYAPTTLDIPADKKRIEVSLNGQLVKAFEYDQQIFSARISSGIPRAQIHPDGYPSATPKGRFVIYSKMPSKHMGSVAGGPEVEEGGGFTLPGVPWTIFFKSPGGYALHGTYWHNNFGLQMSHGCVNMRNEDALWLFCWSTPIFDPLKIENSLDWEQTGHGTQVIVY